MKEVNKDELKVVNEALLKMAMFYHYSDAKDRFPDPSDRSIHQPSVIIQPEVVQRVIQNLLHITRTMYVGDNDINKINGNVFSDIIGYHCLLDIGKRDPRYDWRDHKLFMIVADLVGWAKVSLSGRQIILTA